jgi:Zn-dependent peptidase ImmA (M78 family)
VYDRPEVYMLNIIDTNVNQEYAFLVERFLRFLCDELDVRPRRVTVFPYENNDNISGMCIDESDDEFIILVKEENRRVEDIFVTIAHEMIHVKQHMKENLGWFLDNHSHVPHHDRWWEKEAFSNAVPLVKKFAKTY